MQLEERRISEKNKLFKKKPTEFVLCKKEVDFNLQLPRISQFKWLISQITRIVHIIFIPTSLEGKDCVQKNLLFGSGPYIHIFNVLNSIRVGKIFIANNK
jgi:hypothetical protein